MKREFLENCIKSITLDIDCFRCIVSGGRLYEDYEFFCHTMDAVLANKVKEGIPIEIVVGDNRRWEMLPNGIVVEKPTTDSMAARYAKERGYYLTIGVAPWAKMGKSAGPYRNYCMAQYGHALVAFWNKKSKGTKNMITLAKKRGLPTRVIPVRY